MGVPTDPARKIRTCSRSECALEALWQVCMRFTPRWDAQEKYLDAWTGLCVCGIHKDNVTIADFGETPDKLCNSLTGGHADAVRKEVWFMDISDGLWIDPAKPGVKSPVA